MESAIWVSALFCRPPSIYFQEGFPNFPICSSFEGLSSSCSYVPEALRNTLGSALQAYLVGIVFRVRPDVSGDVGGNPLFWVRTRRASIRTDSAFARSTVFPSTKDRFESRSRCVESLFPLRDLYPLAGDFVSPSQDVVVSSGASPDLQLPLLYESSG